MGTKSENKNKSDVKNNLFFEAALLVIEKQEANKDLLKSKLNINDAKADEILNELEAEGIVSSLLDNNTRDVMMSEEEFSLIYNYKKPIGQNNDKKYDEKAKSQNRLIENLIKLLSLIIFLLIILFLGRRFIFVSLNASTEKTSEEKIGWVQDGGVWNYYDAEGNKLYKTIIDDGGKYYYLDDNGNLAVERWVDYDGKTFYVNKSGEILKNQWIGDYYVGNDGNVLKNTVTPDGYKVGSDGRYIVETKPPQPQTIIIRETVPPTIIQTEPTTFDKIHIQSSPPGSNFGLIVDSEYGTNVIEPTGNPQNVVSFNENINNEKSSNYIIGQNKNYNKRVYLSNDRTCSINILIPVLLDKDGGECEAFRDGMFLEQDAIVEELYDLADSLIEENEKETYTSYKYISSITFNDARIISQDDYSLVIRENGKCSWSSGKSSKIVLTIDFDKGSSSVSYYIEE